jgi:hypothetical protein
MTIIRATADQAFTTRSPDFTCSGLLSPFSNRKLPGSDGHIEYHKPAGSLSALGIHGHSANGFFPVVKLLGHSNISNVTKYAKVTDKLRIEAVNAMPDIGL